MLRRFRFPAFVPLPLFALAAFAAATDFAAAQSRAQLAVEAVRKPCDVTLSYPCGAGPPAILTPSWSA